MFFESMPMEESIEAVRELLPSNPIRVETALSRYPVHRLAKHGEIAIDIRERNANGEVSIKWEVDYSKKHGQPGPLAYKLDTLIINRRIEEAARPVPRIIKLGTLRDLCRELGHSEGENVNTIRKSLRQNAFAGITAKIRYRQNDGTERALEADFTRYSVVFTGEELPNGRKADAVYIILNEIYMQVINGAMTRPLDYDYLKSLPPAPQRFYELLSYQMYAAIKNDRPRAKLLYSELCTYAPLTRQHDWEHARKQLSKIHSPHKKSGYVSKIDCQAITDSDGNPDWIMLYAPGPKARAEFRAFTKRGGPMVLEVEPFDANPAPLPLLAKAGPSPLAAGLARHGVTPVIAEQLAQEHGEEAVAAQVEHLEYLLEKKPGKITDPAAWLVSAIRNGHAAPKGFVSKAERERKAETKRQREAEAAAIRRQEQTAKARERAEREAITAYWQNLSPEEQASLQAEADASADPEALALEKGPLKRMGQQLRREIVIRRLLTEAGRLPLPE